MKGDFSRGFNPDRKRGRDYRRILLQQGRLLLDSDFNASIDAQDVLIREIAADLGCRAGSPDLGFLVTPGVLLALFDPDAGIEPVSNNVEALRDYSQKYLDRYPSLRVTGLTGGGTVRIPFRRALSGTVDIDVHARAAVAVAAPVTGAGPLNVPVQADFARLTVTLTDAAEIEIGLAAGEVIWIAAIETSVPAGLVPAFGVVGGRYYLEGLSVETAGGAWPEVSFPSASGFMADDLVVSDPAGERPLQAGDRIVAYMEGSERHVTAVEDLGIFEQALGTGPDTCTRSADLGQVKLAPALGLDADDALAAFAARRPGGGTLVVETAPQLVDPDPCALPLAGGYTGRDHRLYRFEVHRGGPVSTSLLKWSRDNGSELFRVAEATATTILAAAGMPLRHNDLVEILSERIELADAGLAVLDPAAGVFDAPPRAVGDLARLRRLEAPPGTQDLLFELRDPNDTTVGVTLDLARYGDPLAPQLKLRRWHGLIDPDGAAPPFTAELEDGISVTLDGGVLEPRDWWAYEARVGRDNANGPWRPEPHGDERLFAPLALLEHQGPALPLRLVAWLDERFSSLCSLDADDIAFDGDRIGTDADTVQEVIEELWERNVGGCCEVTLEPQPAGDDAARITDAIAAAPANRPVAVCLRRGVYRFEGTLTVDGREVSIHGCPEVVIEARSDAPPFEVRAGGTLHLRDLVMFAGAPAGAPALAFVRRDARALDASAVGFANLSAVGDASAIRVEGNPPVLAEIRDPFMGASLAFGPAPDLSFEGCTLVAVNAVLGGPVGLFEFVDSFAYGAEMAVLLRQIGRIACRGSLLQIGTDVGALDATAEDLLANPHGLFEEAAGSLNTAQATDGAALAATWVLAGSMQRNVLGAGIALAVARAGFLTLDTNTVIGGEVGIFLKHVERSRIEGQRVVVGRERAIAVHVLRRADRLDILANDVIAQDGEGIVLGGTHATAPQPVADVSLSGVNVSQNGVVARRVGCRIGERTGFFGGPASLLDIRDNQIEAEDLGLSLAGGNPEGGAPFTARVVGNTVIAHTGALVRGRRFEFAGNRFHPLNEGSYVFAIHAEASPEIALHGNIVDGGTVKSAAGISLADCPDATLKGNVVRLGAGPGLQVQDCDRFAASSNRFGGEGAHVVSCSGFDLTGNDLGPIGAHVSACANGSLADNRTIEQGPILIGEARGDWQVNDNRTGGEIRLLPAQDLIFLPGVIVNPGLVAGFSPLFTARRATPLLDAFSVLAGAERVDRVGDARRALSLPPNPRPEEALRFIADTGDISLVLEAELVGEIRRVVDEALVGVLAPPGRAPLRVFLQDAVIRVQMVGNRCANLTVGNLPWRPPRAESVIHVVANSVTEILSIDFYARRNVSQNVARAYAGPILSSPPPITADNLDLP